MEELEEIITPYDMGVQIIDMNFRDARPPEEVKAAFERLDEWIRRRLRCIRWRQWKRAHTRAKNLMKRGLPEERAWKSATNGRGPWWNAGASHMNLAFPKSYFDRSGLVSLLNRHLCFVGSS